MTPAEPSQPSPRGALRRAAITYEVALVTDRAGTFGTVLARPVPRFIEGGRIIVTTLATPRDLEALERHGLVPVAPPEPAPR